MVYDGEKIKKIQTITRGYRDDAGSLFASRTVPHRVRKMTTYEKSTDVDSALPMIKVLFEFFPNLPFSLLSSSHFFHPRLIQLHSEALTVILMRHAEILGQDKMAKYKDELVDVSKQTALLFRKQELVARKYEPSELDRLPPPPPPPPHLLRLRRHQPS